MEILTIQSKSREVLIPITDLLNDLLRDNEWHSGALLLFCPHSTAALTVNENADPDVAADLTAFMRKLAPKSPEFRHAEGNSDAHIKSSLFNPSLFLLVEEGEIMLGTWQGVYFCEWDGPRQRQLWARFLPA